LSPWFSDESPNQGLFAFLEIVLVKSREPFRLACIQYEPVIGAVDDNLAAMEERIRAAHRAGARVMVLPELADTGYVFADLAELGDLAAPIPEGASAQKLIALGRELDIYIVSGLAERDQDRFYNSALLCGSDGYIGSYRKLHLWDMENPLFSPGDLGLPVFETALGRIGLAICYDGWFPELFRTMALAGAELICIPTNWVPMPAQPTGMEAMANTLHRAAAHSNGIFIACANRIGVERGQPFIGQSIILGPDGWPLAGPAPEAKEEILIAEIDLDKVASSRVLNTYNNVLGDRRPDAYGKDLAAPITETPEVNERT